MTSPNPVYDPVRAVTIAGIIGAAIFVGLAIIVSLGWTEGFDRAALTALRNPADINDPLGPAWFEETAGDITALGGYPLIVLVVIMVLAALWVVRKTEAAIFLAVSLITGSVLSSVLKLIFARPRPDIADHLDRTFTSSFPSAHAMVSTIAWFTLAAVAVRFVTSPTHGPGLRRLLLAFAAIIVALVGISRVYLGVHWPTDVLAGWGAGMAFASTCWLVARHLNRRTDASTDLGQDAVAQPGPRDAKVTT